jgi:ribosomal-protein-alanine N-acetyltransferase
MFHNWANDPDVTKYLTWPPHENMNVTRSIVTSWVESYHKEDYYHWMIVLKETGEPIGSLLASCVGRVPSAHIGYCIGKNWWHRGIMSEALAAVLDYLFAQAGMNRIEARHDVRNPHSGGVMKKCGMTYEGTARQGGRNNQGICDLSCYAVLRCDRK